NAAAPGPPITPPLSELQSPQEPLKVFSYNSPFSRITKASIRRSGTTSTSSRKWGGSFSPPRRQVTKALCLCVLVVKPWRYLGQAVLAYGLVCASLLSRQHLQGHCASAAGNCIHLPATLVPVAREVCLGLAWFRLTFGDLETGLRERLL